VLGIHGRQERRKIYDAVLHIFVFARRRGVLWNKTALLTLASLSLRAGADGRVPQTKQKVRLSKTEKGDRMILDYQEREAIR